MPVITRFLTIILCWIALPALAEPVGVVSLHMVDATRQDAVHPEFKREWMVDVYYPAAPARGGKAIARKYAPDAALLARMIADGYYDTPATTLREWGARDGPALSSATPRRGRFPLITLSPGSGVAAFNYARLASILAGHGYVVAVIDHPYVGVSRLPDGRFLLASEGHALDNEDPTTWSPAVTAWAKDVSVTIDHLLASGGKLPRGLLIDAGRILASGHSLGGTIAVQVCSQDRRVSACADFEGAVEPTTAFTDGPLKPTMLTGSRSAKPDRPHVAPDLGKAPWDFLRKGGGSSNWGIAVRGGSHMSFSDAPYEMPDTLSRFGGTLMSPERSMQVYAGMLDAFARAYFPGGGGNAAFGAFLATLPEVKVSSSGD